MVKTVDKSYTEKMAKTSTSNKNVGLCTKNQIKCRTQHCQAESVSQHKIPLGVNPVDIILGRGRRIMNHPGNKELKKLVDSYKDKYKNMAKCEKTKLSRDIVTLVRKGGARFLELNQKNGMFENAPDDVAREKISHLLRARPSQEKGQRRSRAKVKTSKQTLAEDIVDKKFLDKLLATQKHIFSELMTSKIFDVNLELSEINLEEDSSLNGSHNEKMLAFAEAFPDEVESIAFNGL